MDPAKRRRCQHSKGVRYGLSYHSLRSTLHSSWQGEFHGGEKPSTTQGVVDTDRVEQGRNPSNDDAVKAALEKGLSLELACSCTATLLVLLCLCPTNRSIGVAIDDPFG